MPENDDIAAEPVFQQPQGRVPLLDFCPGCGTQLDGQKCKQVCLNQGCSLYRRIIENCAGD